MLNTIRSVRVEGMHEQFNIHICLSPGLNVLYGQNGRGKTTLLHLIANALELDFDRFRFLSFDLIEIEMSNHSKVTIERRDDDIIVRLNDVVTNWRDDGGEEAERSRKLLRDVLGERPNYLPAFRSILERVRNESLASNLTANQQSEFDEIRVNEQKKFRTEYLSNTSRYFERGEIGALTASKTLQCRQWFGKFTPIVRYPSIVEVTDRLENEFREAELEIAAMERRMFSDFFVGTMKTLLSSDDAPSVHEVETLVQRIRNAVYSQEELEPETHGPGVIHQLARAVDEVAEEGSRAGDAEKRVLKLYADILEKRSEERKNSFDRIKRFETAVNKFLDNKTLHITEGRRYGLRGRQTYVESENRQQYSLTSLSSGERQVLTMLFSASRLNAMSGAFLIDEPELSLHIDWQRIVLHELMAQAGGRQIIACTHSPEVGADHMDAVQVFTPKTYNAKVPNEQSPDSLLDE